MSHRIFERTLRPLVFRRACLFERHYPPSNLGFGVGPTLVVPRPTGLKDNDGVRGTLDTPSFLFEARTELQGPTPAGHPPLLGENASFFHKVDLGSGRNTR